MEKVALVAVGDGAARWLDSVSDLLGHHLGCSTHVLPTSLDVAPFHDRARDQYLAAPMLAALEEMRPLEMSRVLGVTMADLFSPVLTYVFGEAHLEGTAAVISVHRLHPQAYGIVGNGAVASDRVLKEAIHEIGHTYGLIHCQDFSCVMRASRVAEEVDLKAHGFCPACADGLLKRGLEPSRRRP
ncbi:MAG: archaemetzincin family Zn-dependent metalloprotease [Gemmatimonadetes bacterium]|jgi:archaemetzincin|nr:archaemetzincin family Zn-dependent metalloprotease [Gemmatimonadota bacterium]MBT6147775.1 archaemetzincin family Zn-dependent metalloprotease [Gemmatimonadota bacterium]MBT7859766.1 archaemetzincin family Zn-dependent metalloprotease [Gemmatimonadota bacterium]